MAVQNDPHRWLKTERPPSVDDVEQTTLQEYRDVLSQWFANIQRALLAGDILLTNAIQVRVGVEQALNQYLAAWDTVFEAMWEDGAQAGRESAARRHGFDISFEITRPEVEDSLEENAERASEQVKSRISGDLTQALLDAHEDGMGIDEIAQLLEDTVFPDMKTWQARRVAQTEVISASNKGNLSAYQSASGVTGKEWLATDDHRTRESHEDIDGQERPIGKPFETGNGNEAMFPGDPSLPASDRINCRCAVGPVVNLQ
jgi:uncharacterized protein with gpF-like domain